MDARGIPKEGSANAVLARPESSLPGLAWERQLPLSQAVKNSLVQTCLRFPTRKWDAPSHRPANPHQAAAYWSGPFPALTRQGRVGQQRPSWTGTSHDKLPWNRHSQTKKEAACHFMSWISELFSWLPHACISPEKVFLLFPKPRSPDIEVDQRNTPLCLWFFSFWQMKRKQWPPPAGKRISKKTGALNKNLYQNHWTPETSSHKYFPLWAQGPSPLSLTLEWHLGELTWVRILTPSPASAGFPGSSLQAPERVWHLSRSHSRSPNCRKGNIILLYPSTFLAEPPPRQSKTDNRRKTSLTACISSYMHGRDQETVKLPQMAQAPTFSTISSRR